MPIQGTREGLRPKKRRRLFFAASSASVAAIVLLVCGGLSISSSLSTLSSLPSSSSSFTSAATASRTSAISDDATSPPFGGGEVGKESRSDDGNYNDAASSIPSSESSARALRLDWTDLSPVSDLARRIDRSQSRCPRAPSDGSNDTGAAEHDRVRVKVAKHPARIGLGSSLHTWAQRLCEAVEHGAVLRMRGRWNWANYGQGCAGIDRTADDPMTCYFGSHIGGSKCRDVDWAAVERLPRMGERGWGECPSIQRLEPGGYSVEEWMAASMEWLFQSVDPAVIAEATRQLEEIYPDSAPRADDLFTVHVRRGDKVLKEMEFQSIDRYVGAVQALVRSRQGTRSGGPLHVYLATVDPAIYTEFVEAAPKEWRIHRPSQRLAHDAVGVSSANWTVKQWMSGTHGLVSLGALLVELQANNYVLTTASNWSRLINELRKNVLNPRCGNCTRMIDLRYGEWPKLGPKNEIQFHTWQRKYNGSAWVDPSGLVVMNGA